MRENPYESTLCCIRCNAKLKNRDEVECYDFNGRVAICRRCATRPVKSRGKMITRIEQFLKRQYHLIAACRIDPTPNQKSF